MFLIILKYLLHMCNSLTLRVTVIKQSTQLFTDSPLPPFMQKRFQFQGRLRQGPSQMYTKVDDMCHGPSQKSNVHTLEIH